MTPAAVKQQAQPPHPAAPPPPSRMTLGAVVSGRVMAPIKAAVYGLEGAGKTTFAAGAPSPIFIPIEEGTNALNVQRSPAPETFGDVLDFLTVLTREKHEFRTVVLDTLDALEPMIWAQVCLAGKKPSIEGFGYGKGYVAALDLWRVLLARLEQLRAAKKMNVVLIAHSQIKKFQNPEGEDFDRYELKLAGKGAAGLIKEWTDDLLFATYEVIAATDEEKERTRGVATGKRIARTVHSGAFDAKSRHELPDPMPLEWTEYRAALTKFYQAGKPAAEEVKP